MPTPLILIVDDDKHIRMTLQEALSSEYETATAATGAEAVAFLDEQMPSLVLLDLKLPTMDGMEVLRRIEHQHPEIPVVVITAHGTADTALTAVEMGAHSFIEKPFEPEHMRCVVGHALDREQKAAEISATYEQHIRGAIARLEEHELDAGSELARRAVALDATRPEGFNLLGVLAQLRSNLREARRSFQAALALDPGYEPAQRNRANLTQPPPRRNLSRYHLE